MLKFLKLFFISSVLISTTLSCSDSENTIINPASALDPTQSSELLNVSYGDDGEQVYDVYLPANRTIDTKVIILVHGGGWTSGDKADMNAYKTIAQQDLPNYAIVNINYRLASQNISPFPMQLNDITSVIQHLKTKQSEYTISQEYALVGVSAGAHLSMLWSYDYDTNNVVNMVASIVGPTNLADPAYTNNTELPINELILLFGETPTTAFLELNSPYHQATTTSPPTILFYGGMDSLIPNSQGMDMETKLTELDVDHDFTFYPNEGHGWVGTNLFDTWTRLKLFIQTHH